jgi:hypothetical protein
MLDNIKVEDVLFLDIETVPGSLSYEMLDPAFQLLWEKKSKQFRSPEQGASDVYERAGIYSEFGKIICISVGLIKEMNPCSFRYPYIARRMIINGLVIPEILDNAGKKPWDVKLLDTMELWKFGDYKNYTSLDLLTSVLGIPSPKDDIDGSMVAGVYYVENDLERIVRYCEKDVLAIGQVLLRFMNLPEISDENIESVTFQ